MSTQKRKPKQRGNGEGSIYKRKSDGRWVGNITVGYQFRDGKRRRVSRTVYGKTRTEVVEKLRTEQQGVSAGLTADAATMTVGEYLAHWLENIAKPTVRPTTYTGYEVIVRKHIVPMIGDVGLSKLTSVNVDALYAAMKAAGKSVKVQKNTHAVLHVAFSAAVDQKLIPWNPCAAAHPPKYNPPEMKTLTSDEAAALMSTAEETRFHALIVMAITTGMRQGELFGLKWGDINLEDGELAVRRTMIELKGRHAYGLPKSKKGLRTISLPQVTIDALWGHKARMLAEGHGGADLVFCDTKGGPLRKSNFYRHQYKPMIKRAGVPDIRFHDLRHTSATLMLEDNVHPKIVQERLGHASISVTLDTYSHASRAMDKQAAGNFDNRFQKASS